MATKANDPTQAAAKRDPKAVKPAPNKAVPPAPTKPQDVEDVERADSEGMAQPQALPPAPLPDDDKTPPNTRRDRPAKR